MKKVLAVLITIVVILIVFFLFVKRPNKPTETQPQTTNTAKKHSPEFNRQISSLIDSYLAMKNAFVDADTLEIKAKTAYFIASTDSLHLDELQEKDSSVYIAVQQNVSDIKANANPILQENDITEMRHDFSMVSENLYPFLKTIGYEGQKLYWQNSPNAFGEDKPANWLSISREINNPYKGRSDQKNLRSGEIMDSIYLK